MVEADEAVAAEADEAAADAGKHWPKVPRGFIMIVRNLVAIGVVVIAFGFVWGCASSPAQAPAGKQAAIAPVPTAAVPQATPQATTQAAAQLTFSTPEAAVDALTQAVIERDREQIKRLFGPRTSELGSGDNEQDQADMQRLSAALQRGYQLKDNDDGGKDLLIGTKGWLFPAPLVKDGGQWKFDTDAGIEEVMDRRVGKNELDAIATLKYGAAAQQLYYDMNPDKGTVREYAHRLASTPGKHDGLYWPSAKDQPESPLGPLVTAAVERGELKQPGDQPTEGKRQAYRGYYYKMLTSQGSAAPGGEMNYIDADGKMTRGFALLAWPADYGRSGTMSFVVAKDGLVYQSDLGKDTQKAAQEMTSFNPDNKWSRAVQPSTAPTTQQAQRE